MRRLLVYTSLITSIFFVVAILSLHFLAPNIDPMVSGISFYAHTNYGILIGLALCLIGVSGIVLAFALWSRTKSNAGLVGLLLIIAWGALSVLAGLFPIDAPGSTHTLSGAIHNLAGFNFLLVTPALLLIELSQPNGETDRQRAFTFWLAWLLLISAILLFTFNGPLHNLRIGGAVQRLYWLVLVSWLLFKAMQVFTKEKTSKKFEFLAAWF